MATSPTDPQKLVLRTGVDNSGLDQGLAESQRKLKEFGGKVAQSVDGASRSLDGLGKQGQEAATRLGRSQQAYLANLQRVIAAEEAGGRNTVEYQRKLAELRQVPTQFADPLLKQLADVKAAQDAAGKGQVDFQRQLGATGLTAKQTAQALRQVPAQFTDIVVSLAGGTAPLTVFLQQGGQLKDVFGSAGTAAQALGRYVVGLINPLTLLAAAVGAVVAGYALGTKETDAFNNALITTGRAADRTLGQLQELSETISDNANVTKGAAAEAITLAVNSGLVGDAIGLAADAAVRLERSLGIGLDKTIAQFKSLGEDPLKAALKLNETTRFLTLQTYEQIRALFDQGRAIDAARLAQEAYADSVQDRTGEITRNLGYIEALWIGIKDAAKDTLDLLKEVGRASAVPTPESLVASTRQQIAALEQKAAPGRGIFSGLSESDKAELEALRFRLSAYQAVVAQKQEEARLDAEAARRVTLKARFDQRELQYLDEKQKATRVLIDLQSKLQEEVDAGAITFDQASAQLQAAQRSIDSKGEDARKNRLDLGIEQIRARLAEALAALEAEQRIFEARRAAGLVGEQQYFDTIGDLIARRSALEIKATDDIIALRQRADLSTKESIDNQREIVKLTTERANQTRDLATSTQVLSIQEQAAAVARVRAYEQARNAAQSFFDTQQVGFERELDSLTRGDAERKRIAGINQINDRYGQQRAAAEQALRQASLAGPPTPEARAQYDQQIALVDEFLAKSLQSWDAYYTALDERQADWRTGATRAIENYAETSANTAAQFESLFTSAFRAAEDAFVEFTKTGELSFKSMAESIVEDLIRIQVRQQIVAQLAQAYGFYNPSSSGFGTGSQYGNQDYGQFFAKGGVPAGGLSQYRNQVHDTPQFFAFARGAGVFGEAGPEAIMPLTRTPDGNLGVRATGGGASGLTVNIIESSEKSGQVQRSSGEQGDILNVFVARVKAEVANDIRRGSGAVPAAMADTYGLNRAPSGF